MNKVFIKMRLTAAILLVLFLSVNNRSNAQFDGGVEDLPVIKVIGTANGGLIPLATSAWVDNTFQPGYEQSRKITNIVRLSLFEETSRYLSADFTVTVPVLIEYGPDALTTYQHSQSFTVSYNKTEGVKYNAKNYFSFENAAYVKITINGAISPASAGGVNMSDILLVENEMRVTRYYQLQPNIYPGFLAGPSSVSNPVDAIGVSWMWPVNSGHNATQLEWTWLENELEQYYYVNGSMNYDLLFGDNATRVDLPYGINSYNIPIFYDGNGKLYYRIRPVNFQSNGSRIDGIWTTPNYGSGICTYDGHNNDLNWQVSTSFAEEGKRKSVVEYFDGSLRSRQIVTKENINNTTIYAETFYDYEGRPAIQILPSPGINTVMKYQANLNLFNAQAQNQNPAEFFDLSPINGTGSALYATPALATTSGTSRYYSPQNDEINIGPNKNIPDAEGYPYSITRYTPDGTGRILAQSGVGPAHKMGSTRETRYYYGSPGQEELDGLFGTEVGHKSHYFKNMVKDANGQMSVSYVDMQGRTIATALAGESPGNLLSLDINNAANYPNQAGSAITRNLLDAGTNIEKGNAIESINTLLVPANTAYSFSYSLAPDKLQLSNCTSQPICYDCMYDLEITITDESGDIAPYVWKFTNVNLNADENCATGTPALQLVSGDNVSIIGNTINFNKTLTPGSYTVRKTLTISESSLQRYKQLFLVPGTGLCKTEQQIIDSVYNVLIASSNCNAPATPSCQSCLDDLGTYSQFQTAYLASIGNPPMTAELQAEIQAAFNAALQNCNNICNTTSQVMGSKKDLMLADMMPYGGQYATETPPNPPAGTSMFNKYNIFSTAYNINTQPYYKKPEPQNGTNGRYKDYLGNTDPMIHPDGTLNMLNGLNPDAFTNIFVNKWAEALLPYHPEYPRLQYLEANLANGSVNIYNWISSFQGTATWSAATTAGYIYIQANGSDINDNFYNIAPGSYRTTMGGWITNSYGNSNLSLWQIARGQMVCQNAYDKYACFSQSFNTLGQYTKIPDFYDIATTADKNQLWENFRNLYASGRDNQVNQYITLQVPLADETTLINQGYKLVFTSNANMASQSGWNWFPGTIGNPPPVLPPANQGGTYQSRCESYVAQWRNSLLQCSTLAAHAQKEQILTEITNGLVSVCQRGSDAANPMGSSTVAPGQVSPTLPNSFEQVISQVFTTYGINQRNNYFCNPYTIEFPKPYGKNPVVAQEYTNTVDSCACKHFDSLKVRVQQAGGNPNFLPSINGYLVTNGMDTLTPVLHQALLGCSMYTQWVCDYQQQSVTVSCYDPNPCTIMCALRSGGRPNKGGGGLSDLLPGNCTEWTYILSCFYDTYGQLINNDGNCQSLFVQFFNSWYQQSYTWSQIAALYSSQCGQTLNVCTPCTTTVTCWVEVNCRTAFVPFTLSSPQPLPDFLKCGGWPPKSRCLTCDSMVVRTTEFKTKFDSPVNSGPIFTGNNLTTAQINQNILYARFMNFRTGFQYNWMEYAQAASAANCNPYGGGGGGVTDLTVTSRTGNTPQQYIASNSITFDPDFDHPAGDDYETLLQPNGGGTGGPQMVICRNNRPLIDTTGFFVVDTPCHRIRVLSVSLGQEIYQLQQQTLLANFEKAYREKCMAAKNFETFTTTYTNKEYHYTLYYYDMSGSLVKTVPPKGARPDFSAAFTNSVVVARANGGTIPRPHEYVSQYRYNSLGSIIAQSTPDAGISKLWYDRMGRLAVNQNAQQYLDNKYSYTVYDALSRLTEVGQVPNTTPMEQSVSQSEANLIAWFSNAGTKEQITHTVYDIPYVVSLAPYMHQQNLRNRISYTYTKDLFTDGLHYTASYFTYDRHGHVDTLLQDYYGILEMRNSGQRFKRMTYAYDLISGKMNMLSYQPGENDAFYHKFKYDAKLRLTEVLTSRDKIEWEQDAAYTYYKHDLLSRTLLGQLQVQGVDHVYTLQGLMKGINGTSAPNNNGVFDVSGDGLIGGVNSKVARDIYGLGLHYFDDNNIEMDYKSIGNTNFFARPNNISFNSLYNGNIGAITVNNAGLAKGSPSTTNALPLYYNYRYDQLNRLRSMNTFNGLNTATNSWQPSSIADYAESATYDPSGNILTYNRKGSPSIPGKQTEMDDFSYSYYANKNQLQRITDNPTNSGNYDQDVDNQSTTNNYTYNAFGNLTSDASENITTIKWTVYGKLDKIYKSSSPNPLLTYSYDDAGNRITKKLTPAAGENKLTVYVRDADDNVMSIYESPISGTPAQVELSLYGTSRIGITTKVSVATSSITLQSTYGSAKLSTFTRGEKKYEISNHLGNISATISDKKIQVSGGGTYVDYYTAETVMATDYYPFGMSMPGRKYDLPNSSYRYSVNGQEKETDLNENITSALFWEYDSRTGRRWNVDPEGKAWLSVYSTFDNNPVINVDPKGNTDFYSNGKWIGSDGINNGLMAIVKDRRLATRIKQRMSQGLTSFQGFMYNGQHTRQFNVIHRDILREANSVLTKAINSKSDLVKEHGAVLDPSPFLSSFHKRPVYSKTFETSGGTRMVVDGHSLVGGQGMPLGHIRIHSHPIGIGPGRTVISGTTARYVGGEYKDATKPSPCLSGGVGDMCGDPYYRMNIIVGKNGPYTGTFNQALRKFVITDNRPVSINVFSSSSTLLFSINKREADDMLAVSLEKLDFERQQRMLKELWERVKKRLDEQKKQAAQTQSN